MGFLDKFKKKATEAVDKHGDTIASGLDKAGAFVDKKTGGKHHDKIEAAKSKAESALEKLDGKDDDIDNEPTTNPPPSDPPASPPPSDPPTKPPPSTDPPTKPPPSTDPPATDPTP
jgi:hypothetical protein